MKFAGNLLASLAAILVSSPFLAHADDVPLEKQTRRVVLERAQPTSEETLRRIEFQTGTRIADADIRTVMQTPEFARIEKEVRVEFCAQPQNAHIGPCDDSWKSRVPQAQ